MAEPNWNPCLNAAQSFFAATTLCGCYCNASARLQIRSASMRLGPIGHHAFNFLNDGAYRNMVSSTQYNSSRSPMNGTGAWSGSEQVDAAYDEWGNLTYSGQRTRNWNDSSTHFTFGNSPVLVQGTYSETATINEHGCLQGSWQFNGTTLGGLPYSTSGTVQGRVWAASRCDAGFYPDRYDCGSGIGCNFPVIILSATQWNETWQCSNSPNGRPGSYTHARTLSQEVTAQDIISTMTAALPDIASIPWEAHVLGVIRRIDYSNTCEGSLGETMTELQNELSALQQSASDANTQVTDYQQQLSEAQNALSGYSGEWQADHVAWQAEKVARCRHEGTMDEVAFSELEERVFARASRTRQLISDVCGLKATLADAEAVKTVADYFVSRKNAAISAVNQRWQLMLEAGSVALEGTFDQMPSWIDKGRAQARVKIELSHPAQGLGETFRCTCGGGSFDITVPAGECIAYGEPFTFTSDTPYGVELENITAPPL
jgi:hypothetical protein